MGATEDSAVNDRLEQIKEMAGDAKRAALVELAQDLSATQSASASPLAALPTLTELSNGIDWFTVKPPPIPMLFTRQHKGNTIGAVPRGQVMILAAPGGIGKTFAGIGACMAVATGGRWLGHFGVTETGSAVGLFGETSREVLWSRLQAVYKSMSSGAPLDLARAQQRLRLLPLAGKASRLLEMNGKGATPTEHFNRLLAGLRDIEDLRLVVIDTLARFGAPDCEVSQTLATDSLTALETLANLPSKPVVIALHHTSQQSRQQAGSNKETDATGVRGVTAITDNARVVWMMESAGQGELNDFIWLRSRKGNDVEASQDKWLLVRKAGGALHKLDDADQRRYDALKNDKAETSSRSLPSDDLPV